MPRSTQFRFDLFAAVADLLDCLFHRSFWNALFLRRRGIMRLTEFTEAGISAATIQRMEQKGIVLISAKN